MPEREFTDKEKLELQSLLCSLIESTRVITKDMSLSIHITPDSSWISIEHQEQITGYAHCQGADEPLTSLIRLPPSCHQIITKI